MNFKFILLKPGIHGYVETCIIFKESMLFGANKILGQVFYVLWDAEEACKTLFLCLEKTYLCYRLFLGYGAVCVCFVLFLFYLLKLYVKIHLWGNTLPCLANKIII